MSKQSGMLKRLENKYNTRYAAEFYNKVMILVQMGADAAVIAASDVLHLGKGRAKDFIQSYAETVTEMVNMMLADAMDDPDMDFTKGKIDARLQQICGENFEPWEVRYGQRRSDKR